MERDARCTLVLRCSQEMFCCFVQGRRVQLRLISSRPRKIVIRDIMKIKHSADNDSQFVTGNIYLRT